MGAVREAWVDRDGQVDSGARSSGDPSGSGETGNVFDQDEAIGEVEQRAVPARSSPCDPTHREVEEHRLTGHAVYRSWCKWCVTGRGRAQGHPASTGRKTESSLPVISWDYCFLGSGDAEANGDSPVLVAYDSVSKAVFAHLVPAKGVDFPGIENTIRLIVKDLDYLGYKRVVFRSDQEPSIIALLRAVRGRWTGEVVPEVSAVGDPQSNGAAESAVNVAKGRIRTAKGALEEAAKVKIPDDHDLLSWLVTFSVGVHRRFAVGRDGRTPYERIVGRRCLTPPAEFGESVWWLPLPAGAKRLPAMAPRFESGRYLGQVDGSNVVRIATPTGVVEARSIRRKGLMDRWGGDLLLEARGSEMKPNALDENEVRIGSRAPVHMEPVSGAPPPLPRQVGASVVRRARLRRCDFATHGHTDFCPGCENIMAGCSGAVNHSEICRARMEAAISATTEGKARVDQAADRFTRYLARKSEAVDAVAGAAEGEGEGILSAKRRRLRGGGGDRSAPETLQESPLQQGPASTLDRPASAPQFPADVDTSRGADDQAAESSAPVNAVPPKFFPCACWRRPPGSACGRRRAHG